MGGARETGSGTRDLIRFSFHGRCPYGVGCPFRGGSSPLRDLLRGALTDPGGIFKGLRIAGGGWISTLLLSSSFGWDGAQRPSSAAAAGAPTQVAPDAGRMLGLFTGATQETRRGERLPPPKTKCVKK